MWVDGRGHFRSHSFTGGLAVISRIRGYEFTLCVETVPDVLVADVVETVPDGLVTAVVVDDLLATTGTLVAEEVLTGVDELELL